MHWTIWLFLINIIIILPLVFITKSLTYYSCYSDKNRGINGKDVHFPYWFILIICCTMVVPILNLIVAILLWGFYISERSAGLLEYVSFNIGNLPSSVKTIINWLNKTW